MTDGHRSKRVRTEDRINDGGPSAPVPVPVEELASPIDGTDSDEQGPGYDIAALAAQAAQAAISSMEPHQEMRNGHAVEAHPAADSDRAHHRDTTEATTVPDVDFSSAPSDPTELALWVAKQISSFGESGRASVDIDALGNRHGLPHAPASFDRRFDEDDDPSKEAERERVREENRERKKRWRESNAERSACTACEKAGSD